MESKLPGHVNTGLEEQHMSESVFIGLCQKVGTPSIVAMRRDVMSMSGLIKSQVGKKSGMVDMLSGSHSEGFRLEGSDLDLMFWRKQNRVIWDLSQASYYQSSKLTLILADSSESPPGFALLQLATPTADETVLAGCVKINGKCYISSTLHKTFFQQYLTKLGFKIKMHGPCLSGKGINMEVDLDFASCYVSDFWPPHASSWIERCQDWLPSYVLNDILKSGCHFVAIGNKLEDQVDLAWRISFSLAEQKLVYSMSHCQFLTYGLLKIFLKEVINNTSDDNKLLCSYHVKTAVFWTIQNDVIPCLYPHNFLEGFWMGFKLVIKWVYNGFCPNFFIPRNNMFLSKIFGAAQKKLFSKLNALYEKGFSCLLESHTIASFMHLPISITCCKETIGISDEYISLFNEISFHENLTNNYLAPCVNVLHLIEPILELPLKQCQIIMLQKVTSTMLKNTAFVLSRSYTDSISKKLSSNIGRRGNKLAYIIDKISFSMLKFAAKLTLGYVSDMLYIVMYFHKTYRYNKASYFLKKTKVKTDKLVLYMKNAFASGTARNTDAATEYSSTLTMKTILFDIYVTLNNKISYISELMLEQYYSLQNKKPCLRVPTLILLHMLEFLCYESVDRGISRAALENLQNRVHKMPDENSKDISWQILGICQQISGNHQAALYAFQQALTAHPINKIRYATIVRILIMIANNKQRMNNK